MSTVKVTEQKNKMFFKEGRVINQRENAQRSTTTPPLFPLHSRKSILAETERYLKRVILVHRGIKEGSERD